MRPGASSAALKYPEQHAGSAAHARDTLATPKDIINEAKNGRMFVLVDDGSENGEGYLVIPAQMATPQAVNFMATHGRGLVCLAITKGRANQLALPMMATRDRPRGSADFAVSIEARVGVTTGISTADRARTIAVAIDAATTSSDIVTPGHIFPLVAENGGLLARAAAAEGAVDVARLAGLNPSGVICAIMDQKGAMAKHSDLFALARAHGLKVGTVRDLVVHRLGNDRSVGCEAEARLVSRHGGEWLVQAYVDKADDAEHLVLRKGAFLPDRPALVRIHPGSLLSDILGEDGSEAGTLQRAMDVIAEEGAGIIIIFRDTAPGSLAKLLSAPTQSTEIHKNHVVGAQILASLGIRRLTLLTGKPCPAIYMSLKRHGFDVVGEQQLADAV